MIKGEGSEPTKKSFPFKPIASGLPNLATTSSFGESLSKTTIAKAPTTWLSAIWVALPIFNSGLVLLTSSIKFTNTSVSVSDWKVYPFSIRICLIES